MMAKRQWFDEESNALMFSQYITQMDSWQEAMADGVIKPEEIQRQADRVSEMLRPKLSDEVHEELTGIFYEMAVLYGMVQAREIALQDAEGSI